MRQMIDVTHDGLPNARQAIAGLMVGDLVALYDTGSPDIAATEADIQSIPKILDLVFIDQGFTGSPNLSANIRDCENGAWDLPHAVDKTGWNVKRPCLYLGYPDTAQKAYQLGWRGDVWLVQPNATPPDKPPFIPPGLNVVAVQWDFSNAGYDVSKVFDTTWPGEPVNPVVATPPPGQWHNPDAWTWKDVIVSGVGLDGNLYTFAYDPTTNLWIKQSLPGYQRD